MAKVQLITINEVVNNLTTIEAGGVLDARQGKALSDFDNIIIADEKLINPLIAFNKRVIADGGTVRSLAFTDRVYSAVKDLLPDTELIAAPECGVTNDSGADTIFNMADAANDLIFNINKWPIGGQIAPNEKMFLKGVTGLAAASLLLVSPIVEADNDSWTLLFRGKFNSYGRIYFGASYLAVTATEVILHNGTDAVLTGTHTLVIGQNHTIECRYSDATGVILIDGIAIVTVVADKAITFSGIIYYATSDVDISYLQINSRVLTAYESQNLHRFLSTEFPAIETIAVGSQQVATSNLEATVFGGTVIPEVQDNAAWAALSTPAWSHYANLASNGAIYGKLYNGFTIPVIDAYAPKGFHVPSDLEWTMLSEYLGGNAVSGGKMKAKYGGFDNGFSTNESGVSMLSEGLRLLNGGFYNDGSYTQSTVSIRNISGGSTSFSVIDMIGSLGGSIRLFSNTPHLLTDTYTSGLFATDIASSPKSIRIPLNSPVKTIRIKSTTSLTSIEAKLYDYAGNVLETLITGKACNATTKSFNVTVDQTMSYTDSYIRVTCAGNGSTGMSIDVII